MTAGLLTKRNVRILYDIARYQLCTTPQIQELHFGDLPPKTEAPRVALNRLKKGGLLFKTQTAARSTQDGDQLAVTKPIPVWYMPRESHQVLQQQLAEAGRIDEYKPFEPYAKHFNHDKSFSDLALAHEIGITRILMSIDRSVAEREDAVDHLWVRTSPRTELVSAKVPSTGGGKTGTINPDAVLFLRMRHNDRHYPFFFFIEYERGTASDKKYLKEKVLPYVNYASTAAGSTPSFGETLQKIAARFEIRIPYPERMQFRVLTVTHSEAHLGKLVTACQRFSNARRFLFTSIDALSSGLLEPVWHIKHTTEQPVAIP